MLKVFFGCSLRGNYRIINLDKLKKMVVFVEYLGCEVVTKDWIDSDVGNLALNLNECVEIYGEEFKKMMFSDVGVFEITNPSTCVGSEVCEMMELKKPVLCIYKRDLVNVVSPYILGKCMSFSNTSLIKINSYSDDDELKQILKEFLSRYNGKYDYE